MHHWKDHLREHWLFFCVLGLGVWATLHFLLRSPGEEKPASSSPVATSGSRDRMQDLPLAPQADLLPPFPEIPSATSKALSPDHPAIQRQRNIRPPDDLINQIPAPPGGWAAKESAPVKMEDIVVVKKDVLDEMKRKGELDQVLNQSYERTKNQTLTEGVESNGLTLEDVQKLRNEGALIVQ